MRVRVVLRVPYYVTVNTQDQNLAERAVRANWDNLFKQQARPVTFPPELTAEVLEIRAEPE